MKTCIKIVTILVFACFTFSVSAFTKGEKFTFNKNYDKVDGGKTIFLNDNQTYYPAIYSIVERSKAPIYCLDPNAKIPDYLYVNRILFDSKAYEAQDTGIIYTLKYSGTPGNKKSFARGIAIRMLYDGIYGLTNSMANQDDLKDIKAAAEFAAKTCDGNGNSNLSIPSIGLTNISYTDFANILGSGIRIDNEYSGNVLKFFCQGYDMYKKVQSGNYDNAIAHITVRPRATTFEGDGETSFVVEIEFAHFTNESGDISAKISGVTATGDGSVKVNGASFKYDDDPKSTIYDKELYNSLTSDMYHNEQVQEQLQKNNAGNAKVYVSVTLTHSDLHEDDKGACNYNAKFKVEFKHPKAMSGAILKADMNGKDASSFQRFAIFDPQNEITQLLNPCMSTCQTSDNLVPIVCEDGLVPDEEDNVVYSFREGYFKDKESYDIKRCILENTDDALNEYQFIDDEHASVLTNNPYCSIYCKEDLVFNLPYKKTVANGRYFNIDIDIAGKQECYSTEINSCELNNNLQDIQEELIEAYNTYIFYDWLLKDEYLERDGTDPACIWQEQEPFVMQELITTILGVPTYYCLPNPAGIKDKAREERNSNSKMTWGKIDFTKNGFEGFITYNTDSADCSADITNLGRTNQIPDYIKKSTKLSVIDNKKVLFGGAAGNGLGYNMLFKIGNAMVSTSAVTSLTNQIYTAISSDGSFDAGGWALSTIVDGATLKNNAYCGIRTYNCTTGTAIGKGNNEYKFIPYDEDYNKQLSYIKKEKNMAAKRIKQIREDLRSNVSLFDSCVGTGNITLRDESGGGSKNKSQRWSTPYLFSPEFTYTYDEPNIDDYSLEQKWIEEVKAIGKDKLLKYGETMTPNSSQLNNYSLSVPDLDYEKYNNVSETFLKSTALSGDLTKKARVFCIGAINEKYECVDKNDSTLSGEYISSSQVASSDYLDVVNLIEIDISNSDKYNFDDANPKMEYYETKVNYVKTNAAAQAHFMTERVFYTSNPTGKILISENTPEDNGEVKQNWELIDGLPVSIQTPWGVYYYKILFENIGTFYTTQQLGRIYGSNASSVANVRSNVIVKPDDKAIDAEPYSYVCTYNVGEEEIPIPFASGNYCVEEAEAYYVCSSKKYDKDTCGDPIYSRAEALNEVGCTEGEACDNNYSCCPDCEISCVGSCIFKSKEIDYYSGESLLDFRAINMSSLNPNKRHLGYNWSSGMATNALVGQKATITMSEIGSRVEITNIDSAYSGQLDLLNETALEVTLTPSMIEYIREYNKVALTSGSYNNQTLECYDYILNLNQKECKNGGLTWILNDSTKPTGDGKCVMANIMCYSTFIDQLQEDYEDNIISLRPYFATRVDIDENSSSGMIQNFDRAASPDFSTNVQKNIGYRLQVLSINDGYWTIFRYKSFDTNGDGIPDIGPSWK